MNQTVHLPLATPALHFHMQVHHWICLCLWRPPPQQRRQLPILHPLHRPPLLCAARPAALSGPKQLHHLVFPVHVCGHVSHHSQVRGWLHKAGGRLRGREAPERGRRGWCVRVCEGGGEGIHACWALRALRQRRLELRGCCLPSWHLGARTVHQDVAAAGPLNGITGCASPAPP